MQDQPQRAAVQKMYRPTKRDILVVTGMATCLMGVLSLVIYASCAQMHAGPLVWPVLLATIWLPGGSLLVVFPFSRWPETQLKGKPIPDEQNPRGPKESGGLAPLTFD